LSDNRDLDTHY